jgi:hypothetical protein
MIRLSRPFGRVGKAIPKGGETMKLISYLVFAALVVFSTASAQIIDATELAGVSTAVLGVLGVGVAITVALTGYSLSKRGANRL